LILRELKQTDWPAVRAIFEQGIATRNATFETEAPRWEEWDSAHLPAHRLVAERDGEIVGWATLSGYSDRSCYRGVAEVSVYVSESARGQGVGRALLTRLVEESERDGIWTLQAGIFPENEASIALHERCGFRVVGTRERIGQLDGVWRDVVLLERRAAEP
jgi:phosphinothricin acetyltransferase